MCADPRGGWGWVKPSAAAASSDGATEAKVGGSRLQISSRPPATGSPPARKSVLRGSSCRHGLTRPHPAPRPQWGMLGKGLNAVKWLELGVGRML